MLGNARVSLFNKARLVALYALRYEKHSGSALRELLDRLAALGGGEYIPVCFVFAVYIGLKNFMQMIDDMVHFAGVDKRQGDLFSNESFLSIGRNVFRGLKGVENVLTQHVPQLGAILENLLKGKLKEAAYPYLEPAIALKDRSVFRFAIEYGLLSIATDLKISSFLSWAEPHSRKPSLPRNFVLRTQAC